METVMGLQRMPSGYLEWTEVCVVDGAPCDALGEPFGETDETETLVGWPFAEARVWLYRDQEILLPVDLSEGEPRR